MSRDEEHEPAAVNQPLAGQELQLTRGIEHVAQELNELAQQLFVTATEIGALSNVLAEHGLIAQDDLKAQRAAVGKRLQALFQEKQIGVKIDTRFPDKYAIPADALPRIDCENRIPLCHAACCSFRFALSTQDIEERVMRWDLGQPYVNRVGADGRCVHQDRTTMGCGIYRHRPGVCRMYDCRQDTRVWLDFEKRVINPDLYATLGEDTMIPQSGSPTGEAAEPPAAGSPT